MWFYIFLCLIEAGYFVLDPPVVQEVDNKPSLIEEPADKIVDIPPEVCLVLSLIKKYSFAVTVIYRFIIHPHSCKMGLRYIYVFCQHGQC